MGENVHTKTVSLSLSESMLQDIDRRSASLGYRRRAHYLTYLFEEDARDGGAHKRHPVHNRETDAKIAVTFNFPKQTLAEADRRAAELGYHKRSHYAAFVIERDLVRNGPHTRTPRPIKPARRPRAS